MILKAFQNGPLAPVIRPAPPNRAWMDAFPDRHAYRCLPLTISNTFGWEILSPCDLVVEWSGGETVEDLRVFSKDDFPLLSHFAKSNFSRGIFTTHTGYIFRTEPGWSLMATGPLNMPIDGAAPLTGIIETDWLPYPFTMNWQLTRPGTVEIPKGSPFCHILPIRQDMFDDISLQIADLEAEPGLRERQDAFAARRGELMAAQAPGEKAPAWGREYFLGQLADGYQAPRHTHKQRLPDPVDLRTSTPKPRDSAPQKKAGPKMATTPDPSPETGEGSLRSRGAWWSGDPGALPLVAPASLGDDMLVVEDFLSADQCALIRQAFAASIANLAVNPQGESFWDERMLWFDQVNDTVPGAKAVMQQARYVSAYRIAEYFQVKDMLYSDSQQLVVWNEGHSMPVHVDNAHPDGGRHNTPHRDFASVIYLNDDYEGGEIYFPLLNCRVKPATGLLIGFRGSADHPHGVTEVLRGNRFTMPSWYSRDRTVAEGSMFRIY